MRNGSISEDAIVAPADGLSVAELDGEAVILSAHTSTYFGLNEVGARAFELAQERPRPVREIVDVMLQEYDAGRDQLTGDLLRFFAEMKEARLVEAGGVVPSGSEGH